LDTELLEIVWLESENEIWLGGAGERKRFIFEELWNRSFGLALRLLVPVTLGLEMIPKDKGPAFLRAQTSFLFGEEDG
jgi:hypothetical protein